MWSVRPKLQPVVVAMFEQHSSERGRSSPIYLFSVAITVLFFAGIASAQYGQYPILDRVADKVVQKYQNSSCEQLWQERGQPKSQREQEAVNFLHNDPQMRRMFIDRVAAPIANKMFECGMIP